MLKQQIRQIVQSNPDYSAITPVIEKEILHHDIMDVLIKQIKERTLDNPEYWAYVQSEENNIASELLNDSTPKNPFDMG